MSASVVVLIELVEKNGAVVPAVVVGCTDTAYIHRELLASTRSFIHGGWSQSHSQSYVRAVHGLLSYYVAMDSPTLDEEGLKQLVWDYLTARLRGSCSSSEIDVTGLYWAPSRWSTVRQICRSIADFSSFCAVSYGYLPLVGNRRVPHKIESFSHRELQRLHGMVERSFLGHLRLLARPAPAHPMPGRKPFHNAGQGRTVLSASQAWDVVEAERNPVYKMIWLLGFWGGPRISEQLNLWRADVLPGEAREVLFHGDPFRELCLVVLANPWESTYCTRLGDGTQTRRHFLRERFELHPRPDLRGVDGGINRAWWAGWKGMMETNASRHISQIFWASSDAAEVYWRLSGELMERHQALATSERHPYMYINLDRRHADVLGHPIKMKNVAKAWERAVRRVGMEPYRLGATIHGMRHFYKAYLEEELGLSASMIKLMMRHRSLQSQHAYGGMNGQAIHHALTMAQERVRLGKQHG